MHFYPLKVSRLTRSLLGHIVWKMDPGKRIIYLTFDDGPVPEATPWVCAAWRSSEQRRLSFA